MPQYQTYFDTLEGERKYDVDFGDNETIEEALRGVLVELAERGHMIRGLSTGDLKVVWGGIGGRELDLSRTLPEQGVRPNEVLRVLVDVYEAGGVSLRADRVNAEWKRLTRLAAVNPTRVEIAHRTATTTDDTFHVRLRASPGVAAISHGRLLTRDTHPLRLTFPRFFPDVPIECYSDEPLFHPNVHPETGFVCLWAEANPRDSVVKALARAQAMAAYRMLNLEPVHQMNRQAAAWYAEVAHPQRLVPLRFSEIRIYDLQDGRLVWLDPDHWMIGRARRVPAGHRSGGIR